MEQLRVQRPEADWLPPVAALEYFEPPAGAHLALVSHARKEETRTRYGYRAAGLGLLIDPNAGSEVLPMPRIAPLPGGPAGLAGLINLRGNLVPLYDLRALLGLPSRPAGVEALALVFGEGDTAVGVIAEGYPLSLDSLRPLPQTALPALPGRLQQHVPAGYAQDDMMWLEFDHAAFFGELCGNTEPATI
jgi:chemotaxis signal transduction protein